ncbi:MAG: hypothetical protein IT181_20275 [Acidobacteria bacterium]|nr:hypothetical protein [Acidobacteriota bacterium]
MSEPLPLANLTPDRLTALLDAHAFKPYRQYRTYSRKEQLAILQAEVGSALVVPDEFSRVTAGDDARAAVVARPLAWDSSFFGLPMAHIDYVLAAPTATRDDRAAVIGAACAAARAAGVKHLTARVDVADLDTLGVLEDQGFRTMDALVTYIMRPVKDPPRDVRTVGAIRHARPEDHDAIIAITREAYQGYRGRFHLDPHLSSSRADELYVEWARQCVSGAMSDIILVSEDSDGRLQGYLAYRRREPASSLGMPIYGGGLGACRRDSPGAYASLIRDATLLSHEHGGMGEYQTQNYNFAVIRVYEAAGAHYVRAEYTLHAWLG